MNLFTWFAYILELIANVGESDPRSEGLFFWWMYRNLTLESRMRLHSVLYTHYGYCTVVYGCVINIFTHNTAAPTPALPDPIGT